MNPVGIIRGIRRVAAGGVAAAALALAIGVARPAAHELPTDVRILAFLKPEDSRARLVVRVPLDAMRDLDFPKFGEGYLDIERADPALRNAATLWLVNQLDVYEEDVRLPAPAIVAVRASLPADRAFESYEKAIASFDAPRLPNDTELYWNQGMLDVLFEYPIRSDRARFTIRVGLARLGLNVRTVLRFLPPGGAERAFEFHDDPGLVRLDPRWHQAALRFVKLGFDHILDGIDHLLFLLCLVIPFRRFGSLIAIVTSFTVAHSITLIASAYDLAPGALWFPPLIETLIAVSIVYMALENIVAGMGTQSAQRPQSAPGADKGLAVFTVSAFKRRWVIAFAFGLVHGFGFSFALRETLQFAGSHLLTSLLSFNIGVELGQILVLAILIPALGLLFRYVVAERVGTIILSAIVAHTAWHWMIDRYAVLRQFRFQWPAFDAAFWAAAMRWAMLAVVVIALYWIVFGVLRAGRRSNGVQDVT